MERCDMRRTPKQRINDILERIERVNEYVGALGYNGFLADELTIDAVTYNLEVIGEAASHVPRRVRAKYPDIDWQAVVRLRDLFFSWNPEADRKVAWDVIKTELPELKRKLKG
jgi:uncharacterized protein with HEPN domain